MAEEYQIDEGRFLLAASIIYMASASGEITLEQWGHFESVVGGNKELLDDAMQKVRDTPLDEFLIQLAGALKTDDQRICVLLNVKDSMWADERKTDSESLVYDKFKAALTVTNKNLEVFLEAIVIKNNINLLEAKID